ncbi:MAG TPA: zinc ribbon domain-containing protein [Pyrinomonadaceae bacterium]
MHCPQCGQQQVSDEVRFCSRCGLSLAAVARLIEGGGRLAEFGEGEGRVLSKRQRGVRKGLIVMAGSFVSCGLAGLLTAMDDDFFPLLLLASFAFIIGLMRMLYGMLLEDDAPQATATKKAAASKTPPALEGTRTHGAGAALPPARGFSAADLARPRNQTAEMAAPSSVTESTTRLLENEERQ